MKKKRRRRIWIILILAVLILVFVLIRMGQPEREAAMYGQETITSGTIETFYSFSGNVAVRDSQAIAAKTNATVREIYAQEDGAVRIGDPLLRLSNGDIIKSDTVGEVTDIHVSVDDTVSVGTPLVDIVNFEDLQILINVDEFDVAAVTVGKEATVTIDALNLVYEGTVEHIRKQAQSTATSTTSITSGSDVTYYEAKLTAPVDDRILPGMKVDVRILNEHREDVLVLSMGALQFDAYNKPYVLMRDAEGSVFQQPVSVGIQDGTTVEITEGLALGDVVLIPQSSQMFMMMQR